MSATVVGEASVCTFHLTSVEAKLNFLTATPVMNKTINLRIAFNLRLICCTLKMSGTIC